MIREETRTPPNIAVSKASVSKFTLDIGPISSASRAVALAIGPGPNTALPPKLIPSTAEYALIRRVHDLRASLRLHLSFSPFLPNRAEPLNTNAQSMLSNNRTFASEPDQHDELGPRGKNKMDLHRPFPEPEPVDSKTSASQATTPFLDSVQN
uniref:Uncharacterized protein n=1 Tax=Rhodosorus marinus TaxID=101924 RepID=A0A7S0BQU6_9RHOD